MKLFKDGGDVISGVSVSEEAGGRVLDVLQFLKVGDGETI